MNITQDYKSNVNYIGNAQWQYNITKYISKRWSGINYTAFWHDILYGQILHKEHFIVNKIILKILLDLLFLFMGFFRCLKNFQIYGCIAIFILWFILFIHTPFYIRGMYK